MSRIAIIDSPISEKYLQLHCNSFSRYRVLNDNGQDDTNRGSRYTHGSICASILDKCAGDYDLISIEISDNDRNGEIEDLKAALQLCHEVIKPDIVSISYVSSILSDSSVLYEISKTLSCESIIVAALDNQRYITVPSSYPFVIGVQSDRANLLQPGETALRENDFFNAPVYANCRFDILKDLQCTPSNSFAVPVVVGLLNNWINEGMNIPESLNRLKPYTVTEEQERYFQSVPRAVREIPVVVIKGTVNKDVFYTCLQWMDQLYKHHEIQSSALCVTDTIPQYDIRIRTVCETFMCCEDEENIDYQVHFMMRHYKTDLIFIIQQADASCISSYDIQIIYGEHGSELVFQGDRMICQNDGVVNALFKILT